MPRRGEDEVQVDARDVSLSNWARWVNCARKEREENVEIMHCAGRVYLITRKDVYPGQELMYYYGDPFAISMNIYYRIHHKYEIDFDFDFNLDFL